MAVLLADVLAVTVVPATLGLGGAVTVAVLVLGLLLGAVCATAMLVQSIQQATHSQREASLRMLRHQEIFADLCAQGINAV